MHSTQDKSIHAQTPTTSLHTAVLEQEAHHQRVFHSDDAAVQDGGRDGWDLEHFPIPGVGLAAGQRISPQVGNELLDLLHFPFGIEGLCLVDGCLWHDHAGRAVLNLREDLDRLA